MVRTPTIGTIVILLVIVSVFAFLTYSFVSPRGIFSGLSNDLQLVEPANEEVSYTDLDGNKVSISSVKGKPLIMNSWATWVPFSKDELLMLSNLKAEYGERVEIIAVNRKENREYIQGYLREYGISRDILFLVDPDDTFYRAISGYAMPETIFYREDGTISVHKRGVHTEEEFRAHVKTILPE